MNTAVRSALVLAALLLALPAAAEEVAPGQTLPAPPTTLYAPMLLNAPAPVPMIRFGTGRQGDELIGIEQRFPYGLTQLFYALRFVGATGETYREEWTVAGRREPLLDASGVLAGDPATIINSLERTGGGPLPRGSYSVRIFIGDQPAEVATALIE